MCFTEKEQQRLDEIARKIADILWETYPEMKGRYTWEAAYESALELVIRFNHPSIGWAESSKEHIKADKVPLTAGELWTNS